mgnify:CR=1 FL=1
MTRIFAALLALCLSVVPAAAHNVGFKLDSQEIGSVEPYGRIMTVFVVPNTMPDAGVQDPKIADALDHVCEDFGEKFIRDIRENTGFGSIEVIAIQVRANDEPDLIHYYAITQDGKCGELLSVG